MTFGMICGEISTLELWEIKLDAGIFSMFKVRNTLEVWGGVSLLFLSGIFLFVVVQ